MRWLDGITEHLNGHEFEHTPGDGEGRGSLACCSPWGHRESDTAQRPDNNKQLQYPGRKCCSPWLKAVNYSWFSGVFFDKFLSKISRNKTLELLQKWALVVIIFGLGFAVKTM